MRQSIRPGLIVAVVGAVLGLWFASMSTADFARHLDRQVHDVHCSFVPGLSGPERGESGCQVTLVSQYSSVLRTAVWGGVPISLPAMAVFAFLLFFAAELWLTGRQGDARAAGFFVAATALPALTSLVMAYLSLVELDAVCKLCIGVYFASALCLAGGFALFVGARRAPGVPAAPARAPRPRRSRSQHEPAWAAPGGGAQATAEPIEPAPPEPAPPVLPGQAPAPVGWKYLGAAFGVGVLFVATPVLSYLVAAPDHEKYIGECGALAAAQDDKNIMVALARNPGEAPAIEVLDPLCPACRGFEHALQSSGFDSKLDRRVVLFPLDNACNWMVDTAVHPGACTVSYAILCAEEQAGEVLAWAFDNQERIREAAAADARVAERMVTEAFPGLARCVRSQPVKSKLNRSLRWAVANRLPVLTPQLYVAGAKLCDEDVDLGLEFALSRMLEAHEDGRLAVKVAEATADFEPAPMQSDEPVAPARQAAQADANAAAPSAAEAGEDAVGGAADGDPAAESGADSDDAASDDAVSDDAEAQQPEPPGTAEQGASDGTDDAPADADPPTEPAPAPDEAVPTDGEPAAAETGTADPADKPTNEAPAPETTPSSEESQ